MKRISVRCPRCKVVMRGENAETRVGYVPRRLRTWIYRCDSCDSTWIKDEREPLREQDGRDHGRDYVWGYAK